MNSMNESGDIEDLEGVAKKDKSKGKGPVLLRGGRSFMRDKLQGKMFLVPGFITVIGVFCGFLAIVSAFKGHYAYATKCIGLALVFDGLDGRVARSLNATSSFGREFDSLSDLVTFGVAPAVLMYCWGFSVVADEFGVLASFVFVVCCATRLARFNINVTENEEASVGAFEGLPSPGAAAALASIVYCFPEPQDSPAIVFFLLTYTFIVAGFMVSTMSFFSIKKINVSHGNPRLNLVLIAIAVALVWKYSQVMILLISTLYCLSGPIMPLGRKYFPHSWRRTKRYVGVGE
jgi:CDP-diacylglycerol--serine O-phosphatidyltransferase